MARVPRRYYPKSVSLGSSSYTPHQGHPFGAMMANEIFNIHDYDDDVDCVGVDDEYPNDVASDTEEYWYQLDLPLENVREMETRFRSEIKKFERAYRKMFTHALQWHYLMEECEENPQVLKMFKDIQMVRKLGGSDRV